MAVLPGTDGILGSAARLLSDEKYYSAFALGRGVCGTDSVQYPFRRCMGIPGGVLLVYHTGYDGVPAHDQSGVRNE